MASSNKDSSGSSGSMRGGAPGQQAETGRRKAGSEIGSKAGSESGGKASSSSGKGGSGSGGAAKGMQGGTSEQHAAAGRQSHKNDK